MSRIETFEKMPGGREIFRHVLCGEQKLEISVTGYGAAITSIKAPDRSGQLDDVVLGFNSLAAYMTDESFMGAVVGRYANRIAHARFSLDGVRYQLVPNNRRHTLHGGPSGFHKQVWEMKESEESFVTFQYLSRDGEEGFPGNFPDSPNKPYFPSTVLRPGEEYHSTTR